MKTRTSLTVAAAVMAAFLLVFAAPRVGQSAAPKVHHLAIQVSSNNPAEMNLALNNMVNVTNYFEKAGESVQIELVAYGPGLNMLREDNSPVKDRLKSIKDSMPNVTFSACGVTLKSMEKTEGKTIALVPQAAVVPAGVVRLMQLQEQGWSYVRP